MSLWMKFLRTALLIPGRADSKQPEIDNMERSLLQGRARVRKARENAELASALNILANETLAKLDRE